ncbi:hypothetical protein [Celerinatantimonas yamalensis]|uniref:Uncharacterized protein n=1 Tax=Celerinatantimonas yamalensis TaxID=559956 RepID=A0ABW9G9C5_9GAMM
MKSISKIITVALATASLSLFANTAMASSQHQSKDSQAQQSSSTQLRGNARWKQVENKFNVGNQHS